MMRLAAIVKLKKEGATTANASFLFDPGDYLQARVNHLFGSVI